MLPVGHQTPRSASPRLLSGRLRGGFLATSLPRNTSSSLSRSGSSDDSESSLTRRDPNVIDCQSSASSQEQNADDSPLSVAAMLRSLHDSTRRIERKLVTVEEKQTKLSDSLKELNALMKKQEKNIFSIKGSQYEV